MSLATINRTGIMVLYKSKYYYYYHYYQDYSQWQSEYSSFDWKGRTEGGRDVWTDGWMNGMEWMDGRTDGRTEE